MKKTNKNLKTRDNCFNCSQSCLMSLEWAALGCIQPNGTYPTNGKNGEIDYIQWGCPFQQYSLEQMLEFAKNSPNCTTNACDFDSCPCAQDIINCINQKKEIVTNCLGYITSCCDAIGMNC